MSTTPTKTTSTPDSGESTEQKPGGSDERDQKGTADAVKRVMKDVSLFSTRRPQHVGAGVASGLKNVGRGVAAGAASLVAMPAVGYSSGGALGAAKGVGAGVASFIALSAAGVATGALQTVRGAINTVEAVKESVDGVKMWHQTRRQWIEVRLPELVEATPPDDGDIIQAARRRFVAEHEAQRDNENHPRPTCKSGDQRTYYEVLDVQRGASSSEIKRAYARMALQHHPDKNLGDAGAAKRFQEVGEAFRVLSNVVDRAEYDRTGRRLGDDHIATASSAGGGDDRHRAAMMPGVSLHPVQSLLGGEAYLPFFGHLRMAVFYFNDQYELDPEEQKVWQERRWHRSAHHLADLVTRLIQLQTREGPAAVMEVFDRRVEELLAAAHGAELACLLADRLTLASERYEGAMSFNPWTKAVAALDDWRQSVAQTGATFSTALTTLNMVRRAHRRGESDVAPDDITPMLLHLSKGDMCETIDVSCDYVLYDLAVSKDERQQRSAMLRQFAEYLGKRAIDAIRAAASPTPALTAAPQKRTGSATTSE